MLPVSVVILVITVVSVVATIVIRVSSPAAAAATTAAAAAPTSITKRVTFEVLIQTTHTSSAYLSEWFFWPAKYSLCGPTHVDAWCGCVWTFGDGIINPDAPPIQLHAISPLHCLK